MGGKRNAYAAQAFVDVCLTALSQRKHLFACATCGETKIVRGKLKRAQAGNVADVVGGLGSTLPAGVARIAPAVELFEAAVDQGNNPGNVDPRLDAEGGSATGAVVMFHQQAAAVDKKDEQQPRLRNLVVGAAIGDVAVLVVDVETGSCKQLNAVERIGNSKADSGGQLNMCIGVSGRVQAFAYPLPPDGLVLLVSVVMALPDLLLLPFDSEKTTILNQATDGLTDNLPSDLAEANQLVPALLSCQTLDHPVPGPGLEGTASKSCNAPGRGFRMHTRVHLFEPVS
eukprot:SAG31_NODE_781_length_12127_cov_34.178334_10_plen_285_part_00